GYQRGFAKGGVGSVSIYLTESDFVAAGGDPGAGDYDEPEPPRPERPRAQRTGLRRESASGIGDSGTGAEVESAGGSDGRPRGSCAGKAETWIGEQRRQEKDNAETLSSQRRDRKSTRLNSSHDQISYAVFCLKKKTAVDRDGV